MQIFVVSDNRVRRVTTSYSLNSTIQTITSFDRVDTIAGALTAGRADGIGQDARFEQPRGVMMSPDGRVYVADSLQCRIRRVSPSTIVARPVTCTTRLVDILRPSGCWLYDPPVDAFDLMLSDVADNIYYQQNQSSALSIQKCLGTPPPSIGPNSTGLVSSTTVGSGGLVSSSGYAPSLHTVHTRPPHVFRVVPPAPSPPAAVPRASRPWTCTSKLTTAPRCASTALRGATRSTWLPRRPGSLWSCSARSTTRTRARCAPRQRRWACWERTARSSLRGWRRAGVPTPTTARSVRESR